MCKVIYTQKVIVNGNLSATSCIDLVITGKIIERIKKRWFRKPKRVFDIKIRVPYIRNPYLESYKEINKKLQCTSDMLKYQLREYILKNYDQDEENIYYK